MKIGLVLFPTEYSISPAELAREGEERGFEALLFPEHTHIPTSRRTPYPGGGDLPRQYSHTLDPFVACTAAAMATSSLLVGTGVCLVIERDPITLAKEVASVDHVSGGRFLFGVGGGWNREEMENHGTDPRHRWRLLAERIKAMKAIWTEDEAAFHGEAVDFDPLWSWPKPVQRPGPPVLVGGGGESAVDRTLDYGDEWMPLHGTADLETRIGELRRRAADAGRGALPVSVFAAPPRPEPLEKLAAAGVGRALLAVPSDEHPDEVRARLDRWTPLISRLSDAA
ncbi:MAG TPA: LLM class F420-dependent oxidoreductase [Acidimicrobiales bacterium]|jgi:probable F420-dependent oxidoreductase|nr:LLM class F420-dependent oxidoreductase [Acidimicrobiales bacterium]